MDKGEYRLTVTITINGEDIEIGLPQALNIIKQLHTQIYPATKGK